MARKIYKPEKYQRIAGKHLRENNKAGLFLDMGLGKTVITATDIADYKNRKGRIKVLIIAPLMVAKYTWVDEFDKWEHLTGITYSQVLGSEANRIKALRTRADVYIINRDNVDWLIGFLGTGFDFDYVVVDESTSFKNHQSKRFKALKKVCPIPDKFIILTGTPSPNTLLDLWAQIYLLDRGQRLGEYITHFRRRYFDTLRKDSYSEYSLREGDSLLGEDWFEKEIQDSISDICISMKTEDWVELPERLDRFIKLRFDGKLLKDYRKFERDSVLALQDHEITAANAAVLSGKLLQYSNGALYTEKPAYEEIHSLKLDALEEIVEAANGNPVLVFYNFKSDLERIMQRLKKYKPRTLKTEQDKKDWNEGKINVFLLHPKSAGHGLNLQHGGNIIVWFGLTWSLEEYMQANKRLHRRGQNKTVIIHHIIVEGTVDDTVVAALRDKEATQNDLIEALIVRMSKYL